MRIFISYPSEHFEIAEKIYDKLRNKGMIPWLDKIDLLPGQNWKTEIKKRIEDSRFIIFIYSKESQTERGFNQVEQKTALEVLDEMSEDKIVIIPASLDNSKPIAEKLKDLVHADLSNNENEGIDKIVQAVFLNTNDQIDTGTREQTLNYCERGELEFLNRYEELEEITRTDYYAPYILISAPAGYGKTRLLRQAVKRMQNKDWVCIHLELIREKKYEFDEFAQALLERVSGYPAKKEKMGTEQELLDVLIPYLTRLITQKEKKQLLFIIDNFEIIKHLSVNVKQAVVSFLNLFERWLDNLQSPKKIKVILSGRYISGIKNDPDFVSSIEFRLVVSPKIKPFNLEIVEQAASTYYKKIAQEGIDIRRIALHLIYLTGGHPGCMTSVLNNYGYKTYLCIEKFFYENISKHFKDTVLPVVKKIREDIPDHLRNIFDIISPIRRFTPDMLSFFIDSGLIDWKKGKYDLEEELLQTYLITKKGGFLQDDMTSRLLSIYLLDTSPKEFQLVCETSIKFYEKCLKERTTMKYDDIAIELFYQRMRYMIHYSEIKESTFRDIIGEIISLINFENTAVKREFLESFRDKIKHIENDDDGIDFYIEYFLSKMENIKITIGCSSSITTSSHPELM